jgi:four helix bundle protein
MNGVMRQWAIGNSSLLCRVNLQWKILRIIRFFSQYCKDRKLLLCIAIAIMFLKLDHQNLDIYRTVQFFVSACYKLTKSLPSEEKFNMIQQIRRAALSVHLNIAEGASKRSTLERKRYYGVARSSLVEIDAALDLAEDLQYIRKEQTENLGYLLLKCFKMLTKMIN